MRLPAERSLAYICVPFFALLSTGFTRPAQTYTFVQGLIPAGQLPSAVARSSANAVSHTIKLALTVQ
jgi:hypothetical protein